MKSDYIRRNLLELWLLLCGLRSEEGMSAFHQIRKKTNYFSKPKHYSVWLWIKVTD